MRIITVINTNIIESPLGPLFAGATDKGICMLEFCDPARLKRESADLVKLLGMELAEGMNEPLARLITELEEYFEGKRKEFTLSLVAPGTPFQREVWKELLNIPFGSTRTYSEQANALGRPDAVRAVAGANGLNRIVILIPCHRVIGADGSLTGYGGGLERKHWLLEHERKFSGQPHEMTLF